MRRLINSHWDCRFGLAFISTILQYLGRLTADTGSDRVAIQSVRYVKLQHLRGRDCPARERFSDGSEACWLQGPAIH
jgi:hypothetical protein